MMTEENFSTLTGGNANAAKQEELRRIAEQLKEMYLFGMPEAERAVDEAVRSIWLAIRKLAQGK